MSSFRVTHKLGATSLYESYAGVSADGAVNVVLRRMLVKERGFLARFAPIAAQWKGLPVTVASRLVDVGTGAGSIWVVQEAGDGWPLDVLLARSALTAAEASALVVQAASSLAALHELQPPLCHGAVNADALVLTRAGSVTCGDLGLAVAAGAPPGSVAGDVFSLGGVWRELLRGNVPTELAAHLAWMRAADASARPQMREVENALESSCEKYRWQLSLASLLSRLSPIDVVAGEGKPLELESVLREEISEPRPSASVLGRIATKKMTAEELEAARAAQVVVAAPPPSRKPGELAVTTRLRLSGAQLSQCLAYAQKRGVSEGEAVLALGYATEDDVISAEAELTASRWMSSQQMLTCTVDEPVRALFSAEQCTELQVCPLSMDGSGKRLMVAMRDPFDAATFAKVRELAKGAQVTGVRVGPQALKVTIDRLYAGIDSDDPESWLER